MPLDNMKNLSPELNNWLSQLIDTDDVSSLDYPSIPSSKQTGLNYNKVRGSVRLLLNRVLTPFDVQELEKDVFSRKLP